MFLNLKPSSANYKLCATNYKVNGASHDGRNLRAAVPLLEIEVLGLDLDLPFFIDLFIGNGRNEGVEVADPGVVAAGNVIIVEVLGPGEDDRIPRCQDVADGQAVLTGVIEGIEAIRRVAADVMFLIPEAGPQAVVDALVEDDAGIRIAALSIIGRIPILAVAGEEAHIGTLP